MRLRIPYHNVWLLKDVRLAVVGLVDLVLRSLFRCFAQPFFGGLVAWALKLTEQAGVVELPKEVAGVEVAFADAFVGSLGELPSLPACPDAARHAAR